MKRDKFDAVISDLVRLRANFTCEHCGISDPDGQMRHKSEKMDASHFNSRGAGNVCRYDTDMIFCLCKSCHEILGKRPGDHTRFCTDIIGQGLFDLKLERHNKPYKFAKGEKEEMHLHYKAEFVRLQVLRANGNQDYIEVKSWF